MKNYEKFFKEFEIAGNIIIQKSGYKVHISLERLYQNFKERLLDEMDSEINDKIINGICLQAQSIKRILE